MHLDKETLSIRIGYRIREIRNKKGISIETLSSLADMEYTQLSRIELGKINTTLFQIYKICISLEITVQELLQDVNFI